MSDLRHVRGLRELQRFLDQFPVKMERNIMRGALRAGMNVVKPAAQRGIHSVSGQLAAGLKVRTRARRSRVMSRLVATGPHGGIAHLVEYGTAAHTISVRVARALAVSTGVFRKTVEHPGTTARPFMRPALDSQAAAATVAVGNYIKHRLKTKHGIDTAHITVEGDE